MVQLMMMVMTTATSGTATADSTAGSTDAGRGTTPQQFAHPNATRSGHIDIPTGTTGTGAAYFYATVTSAARTGHRSTAANYTNITITTTITTRSITITFIDTFVAVVAVSIIVIR